MVVKDEEEAAEEEEEEVEKDEVGFPILYRISSLNSFQSRAFRLKRGKEKSDLGTVRASEREKITSLKSLGDFLRQGPNS